VTPLKPERERAPASSRVTRRKKARASSLSSRQCCPTTRGVEHIRTTASPAILLPLGETRSEPHSPRRRAVAAGRSRAARISRPSAPALPPPEDSRSGADRSIDRSILPTLRSSPHPGAPCPAGRIGLGGRRRCGRSAGADRRSRCAPRGAASEWRFSVVSAHVLAAAGGLVLVHGAGDGDGDGAFESRRRALSPVGSLDLRVRK
jgi:hypothetical protein